MTARVNIDCLGRQGQKMLALVCQKIGLTVNCIYPTSRGGHVSGFVKAGGGLNGTVRFTGNLGELILQHLVDWRTERYARWTPNPVKAMAGDFSQFKKTRDEWMRPLVTLAMEDLRSANII